MRRAQCVSQRILLSVFRAFGISLGELISDGQPHQQPILRTYCWTYRQPIFWTYSKPIDWTHRQPIFWTYSKPIFWTNC
jgi:hypothetical protein